MRNPGRLVLPLLLWVVGSVPAPAGDPAPRSGAGIVARAVHSVGCTVADLDRSVEFFTQVLCFRPVGAVVEVAGRGYEELTGQFGVRLRVARLMLGDEVLELTEVLAPSGRPYPEGTRSNDQWFQHIAIVVRDMDRAYARLREHRVRFASSEPQLLPEPLAAAGIRAFYFRDPDGHFLEILQFPPDKGDARWHAPGDALFLGIDHTAIVTRDTERSLAYFQGLLGFRVTGESVNYGVEQEHLNNVFGARLRITTLRCPAGPGVELLEYLTPRDGRPTPTDLRFSDQAFWQTTLVLDDVGLLYQRLAEAQQELGSAGVVSPGAELGIARGFLAYDPDRHPLRMVELAVNSGSSDPLTKE